MTYQCIGCGKSPDEIEEYVEGARMMEVTPQEFVEIEEGTFNSDNGHFACTTCYIKMGMPPPPRGWRAP